MSTKHTPGPLEVRMDGTYSGAWAEIVQRCIDPATDEVWFRELARTETTHVERTKPNGQPIDGPLGTINETPERFEPTEGSEELIANAHLWAASPKMYAALEAFLRAPSIGSNGPGSVTIVVQTFNLRAAAEALAEAKGQKVGEA